MRGFEIALVSFHLYDHSCLTSILIIHPIVEIRVESGHIVHIMSVSTLRSQRFALIQEKLGVTLHEAAGPAFSYTWTDPSELE